MPTINKAKEDNYAPDRRVYFSFRKFLVIFSLLVVVAGGIFLVYRIFFFSPVIKDAYQAVFLTNGQTYFGKLNFTGEYAELKDVYYLRAGDGLQQTSSTSGVNQNVQLVKLGNELHGPLDVMYISKKEMIFWENLKDASKVSEAIKRDKSNQKIVNSSSQDKF